MSVISPLGGLPALHALAGGHGCVSGVSATAASASAPSASPCERLWLSSTTIAWVLSFFSLGHGGKPPAQTARPDPALRWLDLPLTWRLFAPRSSLSLSLSLSLSRSLTQATATYLRSAAWINVIVLTAMVSRCLEPYPGSCSKRHWLMSRLDAVHGWPMQ